MVILGTPDPLKPEVESTLDSNDTRMQQVTYADGKLYGALDTAITAGGGTYPAIGVNAAGKGVVTSTLAGDATTRRRRTRPSTGVPARVASSSPRPARDRKTGSPVRRRSTTRPGHAGVTTEPLRSTARTSGSPASTSVRPAPLPSTKTAPFGSCGATRTALANWDTGIRASSNH